MLCGKKPQQVYHNTSMTNTLQSQLGPLTVLTIERVVNVQKIRKEPQFTTIQKTEDKDIKDQNTYQLLRILGNFLTGYLYLVKSLFGKILFICTPSTLFSSNPT